MKKKTGKKKSKEERSVYFLSFIQSRCISKWSWGFLNQHFFHWGKRQWRGSHFFLFFFLQVPYNVPLYKTWTTISSRKGFIEMDDHTRTLSAFIAVLSRYDPVNWNFGITLPMLGLLHQHEDRQIECPAIETNDVPLPETILTGLPGWPRYSITTEQICHCVSTVMAWQGIASCFGISRRTLYRQTISWNGATDIV